MSDGAPPKGEIKIGRVAGADSTVASIHFETEDGERFAITNLFSVRVEEIRDIYRKQGAPFLFDPVMETQGFRIEIEARQVGGSIHDESASHYDFDAEAEEIPDQPRLTNPPLIPEKTSGPEWPD